MIHITNKNISQVNDTSVALGNFDGLHLGHQKLIDVAKESEGKTVVFSLFPHPEAIFKNQIFKTILTSSEKSDLLAQMGVDIFIEYPFDRDTAEIEAEKFICEILFDKLRCKTVVVGEDYRFGKNGSGNCELLLRNASQYGYSVKTLPHIKLSGEKISSTRIRNEIVRKCFSEVAAHMGRPYFLTGKVAYGNRIGHTIDVPTANIVPSETKLLPPSGVYRTKVRLGCCVYDAVTHVGTHPTVGDCTEKVVETHLLGFKNDIYGEELTVEFYKWIRDEIKFNSIEELKAQILKDIACCTG